MQRAASLAAALRSETPRRAWRDFEPPAQQQAPQAQPAPRLRSSIMDGEGSRTPAKPEPAPRPAPRAGADRWPSEAEAVRAAPRPFQDPILSGGSAQAVQSSFHRLADSVLSRATGDRSIEDMTRELLKGMLKQWLDDNLPQLVERLVREEIERVARTGR